ncbi:MAG: zinc ribbon domain-containing protein [Actinobacteria bacterium]|nr:zinc ribbon domain-containing protein [Actinomycetota bacterium]
MPLYEFRCGACGRDFERLLSVGGERPSCPACGSADVTRLISLIAGLGSSGGGNGAGTVPHSGGGCGCGGACACGR